MDPLDIQAAIGRLLSKPREPTVDDYETIHTTPAKIGPGPNEITPALYAKNQTVVSPMAQDLKRSGYPAERETTARLVNDFLQRAQRAGNSNQFALNDVKK